MKITRSVRCLLWLRQKRTTIRPLNRVYSFIHHFTLCVLLHACVFVYVYVRVRQSVNVCACVCVHVVRKRWLSRKISNFRTGCLSSITYFTLCATNVYQQTTNWWFFYHYIFSHETGFDITCKLFPNEIICMKYLLSFFFFKMKTFQSVVCWDLYPACQALIFRQVLQGFEILTQS